MRSIKREEKKMLEAKTATKLKTSKHCNLQNVRALGEIKTKNHLDNKTEGFTGLWTSNCGHILCGLWNFLTVNKSEQEFDK